MRLKPPFYSKVRNETGTITRVPNLTGAQEFSVLIHETAHEVLHRGDRRSRVDHKVRETQAEAVAFVVSTAIGLEPGTSSSDYIQLHSGDKTTPADSLEFIQRTAMEILQAVAGSPPNDSARLGIA